MIASAHRPTTLSRIAFLLSAALVVLAGPLVRSASAQFGVPSLPRATPTERPGTVVDGPISIRAVANASHVLAGGDLALAIVIEIEKPWHVWTNRRNALPGVANFDAARLTEVRLVGDVPGVVIHGGFAQWPEAHRIKADVGDGPLDYAVFEGTAPIFLPVTINRDAAPGERRLRFEVRYQACDDSQCLAPTSAEVETTVTIVPIGEALPSGASAAADPIFRGFDGRVFADIRAGVAAPSTVDFNVFGWEFSIDARGTGFALLLLVAAVGGFLLNLTPCVLPVIPLKIMGLAQSAGSRGRTMLLGLAMSLGVVGFWMALGIATTTITGFTSVNQLFQYPVFTIGIGLFIAVMAIGMLGVFSVGLPQWVYFINPKSESIGGAVGFGVMTAILSTPCTAPLMGSAVAWATTQQATTVLAVFAAVGGGMALPYLVLAAFPSLVKKMPRSGPASEVVKQVMGLLLLAAALYFIGAGLSGFMVTPPDPPSRLYWWAVAGASFLAGAWLIIRTLQLAKHWATHGVFGGLGILIVCLAAFIGFSQTAKGPIVWTYYTPARFDEALARGDVIVLDFTAEWCLNCKALESSVLYQPEVAAAMNSAGVTSIKVDLTGNNPDGNARLKAVDRVTIPLLVVYAPDGREVFKSEFYGPQQVLDAIEKARGAASAGGERGSILRTGAP